MDIVERLRENADLDAAEHVPDDVVQMQYEAADEIERMRNERDALAATVVELRKVANDVSIIGGVKYGDDDLMKMLANAVFSSVRPTAILAARDARVKAEALREADERCMAIARSYDQNSWKNRDGAMRCASELRRMADAIEKGE